MKLPTFIAFLPLFVALCLPHLATQDPLDNFVRVKMANYSTWLQANNLDPSPLVSGPTVFEASNNVTNMSVLLSNYGVSGHSGQMRLGDLSANFSSNVFMLNLYIKDNVTFYGDYTANGTMLDGKSITGNGTWSVQVGSVGLQWFAVAFEENSSGFLDMTISVLTYIFLEDEEFPPHVYFDSLLEHESAIGHEDDVRSALFNGFQTCLHDDGLIVENPLRTLFLKYWKEIFSKTTLEDIQNTPPPKST